MDITVLITSKRTGKSCQRTMKSLEPILTGNDYQTVMEELKDSGISESDFHIIELMDIQ